METDSPALEEFFFLDSHCEELKLSKRELATESKTTTHPEVAAPNAVLRNTLYMAVSSFWICLDCRGDHW